MDQLRLSVPATHYTFLTSHGDNHSPAVSGSVQIPTLPPRASDAPIVNVCLIRLITSGCYKSNALGTGKRSYLRRIAKPVTTRSSKSSECTDAETVVQCNLHCPLNSWQDSDGTPPPLHFSLPIPNDIPGTTETALGSVSYTIRATASWSSGRVMEAARQINIIPRMVLSHCEPIECRRSYRNATMTTKLRLMPTLSSDPRGRVSYHAELLASPTTTPGPRRMEMRYVVIKEVKWQIQETVKVMALPCDANRWQDAATCKEQHVRQLCGGNLVGRWQARKEVENIHDRDDRVKIDFNISIPKAAKATSGVQLSSYSHDEHRSPHRATTEHDGSPESIILTVDHQLKIDLITGEDTFDLGTGKLVDRKPLFKSFSAFFPLPIHELYSGEHAPEGIFNVYDTLPRYDDTSLMPPCYEATA